MPAVAVEDMPAKSNAMANKTAALLPNKGLSKSTACAKSSTFTLLAKNTAAATKIMALLIAQPMLMESSVSKNSKFSWRLITASSSKFQCRLWMTSECKKRLWGITTAPNTLMITKSEPLGMLGVTQPLAAAPQSRGTIIISAKKDRPIIDTKPIIIFSSLL